jgi:hypothetical protein
MKELQLHQCEANLQALQQDLLDPGLDTQVLSKGHITSESNLPIKSEERTSYPKNLTEGLVSATVSTLT